MQCQARRWHELIPVKLADLPIYCLTTREREDRHRHIADQLRATMPRMFRGPTEYRGLRNPRLCGCIGYASALDRALRDMGRDFRPFLLIEDDVSRMGADLFTLPPDADALYLGITSSAMMLDHPRQRQELLAEPTADPKILRVLNLLTTHAIVYVSPVFAAAAQRACVEAAMRILAGGEEPWDCNIARLQPSHRVYALIEPMFYQDMRVGGWEHETRRSLDRWRKPSAEEARAYFEARPVSGL